MYQNLLPNINRHVKIEVFILYFAAHKTLKSKIKNYNLFINIKQMCT